MFIFNKWSELLQTKQNYVYLNQKLMSIKWSINKSNQYYKLSIFSRIKMLHFIILEMEILEIINIFQFIFYTILKNSEKLFDANLQLSVSIVALSQFRLQAGRVAASRYKSLRSVSGLRDECWLPPQTAWIVRDCAASRVSRMHPPDLSHCG
jgi:hypothetical protein